MCVSQTIHVPGQRSWLQHSLEEQKFKLPAGHAAGLELAVHVCSGATPWAKQGQSAPPCSSPRQESLLPSHREFCTQIPLPQTHLKVVTEIKPYVESSQLLDTSGCWVGRINQLCFHFKTLQLVPWQALGRRVAATCGEINPTPETSLNLPDRGCSHTLCPSVPMGYEMKTNP